MKTLVGLLLIACGVGLGLYVGVYVCFVKGIVIVVEQIRAPVLETATLAWGIVRILFAGAVGTASALFLIVPGAVMLQD